nr:hypothetical protein [uncultured bacterium]
MSSPRRQQGQPQRAQRPAERGWPLRPLRCLRLPLLAPTGLQGLQRRDQSLAAFHVDAA